MLILLKTNKARFTSGFMTNYYRINRPSSILFDRDRKHRAAELAGFTKTKSGKYSDRYEAVMLGQDETANIQIVRYILQFKA